MAMITPTRVALTVLIAAGISVAVWRLASRPAEEPTGRSQPVQKATAPSAVRQSSTVPKPEPERISVEPERIAVTAPKGADLIARAQRGDARAAFHLSLLLGRCEGVESKDAELRAGDFASCQGVKEDRQYWRDKALAARDPLALSAEATAFGASPDLLREAAEIAARNGDEEAQEAVGSSLASMGNSEDGLAWLLLVCPDCRVTEGPLVNVACDIGMTTCYDGTKAEYLAENFGRRAVEKGKARAVLLQAAIDKGESLDPFLRIPGAKLTECADESSGKEEVCTEEEIDRAYMVLEEARRQIGKEN